MCPDENLVSGETTRDPSSGDDHAALTGFHFRPKFRFARSELPVRVSLEYAFVKQPGDLAFVRRSL